jgi:hypothetical protein
MDFRNQRQIYKEKERITINNQPIEGMGKIKIFLEKRHRVSHVTGWDLEFGGRTNLKHTLNLQYPYIFYYIRSHIPY